MLLQHSTVDVPSTPGDGQPDLLHSHRLDLLLQLAFGDARERLVLLKLGRVLGALGGLVKPVLSRRGMGVGLGGGGLGRGFGPPVCSEDFDDSVHADRVLVNKPDQVRNC